MLQKTHLNIGFAADCLSELANSTNDASKILFTLSVALSKESKVSIAQSQFMFAVADEFQCR
jgi:hypothetical protein